MNSKKNNSTTKNLPPNTGETSSTQPEIEQTEEQKVDVPETSTEMGGGKTRRLSKYGSRRKVWNGTAEKTKGGLTKNDLIKNKYGRIVSTKRHTNMKKRTGGGE